MILEKMRHKSVIFHHKAIHYVSLTKHTMVGQTSETKMTPHNQLSHKSSLMVFSAYLHTIMFFIYMHKIHLGFVQSVMVCPGFSLGSIIIAKLFFCDVMHTTFFFNQSINCLKRKEKKMHLST